MADPFLRQFFGGRDSESMSRENWLGCGIIVAPDGYILTADHVVDGADEIKILVGSDKTKYSAKIIGMDPPTDVAILKIQGRSFPAVTLGDSDQLEVGDVVLAVGNPFGVGQTVTRGIISALGRSLSDSDDEDSTDVRQYQNFIQTDAAINEGNSGGALVDAEGRLIGINDAIVSPSQTSAGVGFAVPINLARSVMDGFLKGGRVARGYLGIEPQDIDAGLAKDFGAPNTDGALITDVTPNSPAAKAGLKAGDVVVGINGREITTADSLRVTVSELAPGSEAKVKIYRNGNPKTIGVTLAERPGEQPVSAKVENSGADAPAKADALDGVAIHDLTPRLRVRLGAQPGLGGALVIDVDRISNAYDAGLRQGDVILEVNHQPAANAQEISRLCRAALTDEILIKIWRPAGGGEGITRFLSVDNTRHTK
jgi:serine protease Do